MKTAGISGIGAAAVAGGAYLMYAGIRDVPLVDGLREIVAGRLPEGNRQLAGDVGSRAADAAREALRGMVAPSSAPSAPGGGGAGLAAACLRYLGVPYRWGGADPASGLDCSGLVQRAFADMGIRAPRTTYTQQPWTALRSVPAADRRRDDLAFWPGHVAVLVDADTVVHAPRPGTVVRTERLDSAGPRGTRPVFKRYAGPGRSGGGGGGTVSI